MSEWLNPKTPHSSARRWSFGSSALIRRTRRSLCQHGPQLMKRPLLSRRYTPRKLKAEWRRCVSWPISGTRPKVAKATVRVDSDRLRIARRRKIKKGQIDFLPRTLLVDRVYDPP